MSCIRILAEPMKCRDLKPGDLFSVYGPDYWGDLGHESHGAVGESVYVRTHVPAQGTGEEDDLIFRITITRPRRCSHCYERLLDCKCLGGWR